MSRIKARRGSVCEQCGQAGRVVGDHVVELKDGGAALDEGNVRLLCWSCHTAKTHRARVARLAAPARATMRKTGR